MVKLYNIVGRPYMLTFVSGKQALSSRNYIRFAFGKIKHYFTQYLSHDLYFKTDRNRQNGETK